MNPETGREFPFRNGHPYLITNPERGLTFNINDPLVNDPNSGPRPCNNCAKLQEEINRLKLELAFWRQEARPVRRASTTDLPSPTNLRRPNVLLSNNYSDGSSVFGAEPARPDDAPTRAIWLPDSGPDSINPSATWSNP